MKQDTKDGMKLIGANVVSMQVFVIINNVGIMKNLDVNVNNLLTKLYMIKNLFGILINVNVTVIDYMT